ncbi:lipid-transfer protein [Chloroflexota bacterium]
MFDQYLARRYRTEVRPSPEAYLIKDRTAVVGVANTEFSKNSGRTTVQMACEVIKGVVEDAGMKIEDIDGLVRFTGDATDEDTLINALGIPDLNFFGQCPMGGSGGTNIVMHAALAVATGVAKYVVAYRSMNEYSGARIGRRGEALGAEKGPKTVRFMKDSYGAPYGFISPVSWVATFARRYMHVYSATREHLAWVSINNREHAQTNPNAMFYGRPITMKDYFEAPMVVEPFCRLDCCLDSDGAVALLVTTAERARDLKQRPAYILAAVQGTATDGEMMTSHHRPRIERLPESWYTGEELWRVSGVTPKDIDVCQLYDAFSILPIAQLEEYGFCGEGEGPDFCWERERIKVGGELPINTSGGLMSEAYIHGVNLVAEAVRQIRGTSLNQVKDAELSMVTAGLGVPTGAIIFRR